MERISEKGGKKLLKSESGKKKKIRTTIKYRIFSETTSNFVKNIVSWVSGHIVSKDC